MRTNLEIKLRCSEPERVRERVQRIATAHGGLDHQVDTYFRTRQGRLKLRESSLAGGQLVPYLRPDRRGARRARYQVLAVPEAGSLKTLLSALLGIHRVVVKEREIFFVENVRIHLDRVEGLGDFVELEAVYDGSESQERIQQAKLTALLTALGLTEAPTVAGSYETLLAPREGGAGGPSRA